MDEVLEGFLDRNLPKFKDNIDIDILGGEVEQYRLTASQGRVHITATNYIVAINGLYDYLKKYCRVQLSWCGNRTIDIDGLVMFDGEMTKTISERWRVYMNYCTLDYSMCWWDFARWEREIDFMAMNGINMPLAVVGSEAVWYYTLVELGLSESDALSTVTGPAFWAWHLMTNIEGYLPPKSVRYIEERLALGKAIMSRYLELGMTPIEQGFSGHVPLLLRKVYPKAKITRKWGWGRFPSTGQLDPLDPLFERVGLTYLRVMDRLIGNHHYIAADPFHEGVPPRRGTKYLTRVGEAIDHLFATFDPSSVWVMQGWTPRDAIIKAVPRDRLLILDLSSTRALQHGNFWGYDTVAGMLHNFGGKNAMQGKIRQHASNIYKSLKSKGVNVVGTGMFMEGIEQNPVVYDLQFRMLTESDAIDFDSFLRDYLERRYGGVDDNIMKAWSILMDTCYSDSGYEENEVGSTLASRPQIAPVRTGPCCYVRLWYDPKRLEEALRLMLASSDRFGTSDGYQYDITDIMRQVMSNRFYTREQDFDRAYESRDIAQCEEIAKCQLALLLDMDELLSHRSEMCLSRWICMAKSLATDDEERAYYELNARALITMWGNINGDSSELYDYSWREWSGLISEYYYMRWDMFYKAVLDKMRQGKRLRHAKSDTYKSRLKYRSTPYNEALYKAERAFVTSHKDYDYPIDSDALPSIIKYATKYGIL